MQLLADAKEVYVAPLPDHVVDAGSRRSNAVGGGYVHPSRPSFLHRGEVADMIAQQARVPKFLSVRQQIT